MEVDPPEASATGVQAVVVKDEEMAEAAAPAWRVLACVSGAAAGDTTPARLDVAAALQELAKGKPASVVQAG